MTYRTKTYIAGDWTGDSDAIKKLYEWNESNYWSLSFIDAHEITKANDTSLNCSIKSSLKTRMDASKKFVLIVGENTNVLRRAVANIVIVSIVIQIIVHEVTMWIIEALSNMNAIWQLKRELTLLFYIIIHM